MRLPPVPWSWGWAPPPIKPTLLQNNRFFLDSFITVLVSRGASKHHKNIENRNLTLVFFRPLTHPPTHHGGHRFSFFGGPLSLPVLSAHAIAITFYTTAVYILQRISFLKFLQKICKKFKTVFFTILRFIAFFWRFSVRGVNKHEKKTPKNLTSPGTF
jgi:hypothetical protein